MKKFRYNSRFVSHCKVSAPLKGPGIKYQLRITTLIPVSLVALLFAFFYNAQFSRDLEQHLSRLGEAYIRQLIPAAQFALLRHDSRTLQGLVNASTINPDIKALAFYNANGQLLAYRGGKHSLTAPFNPPPFTGDYVERKSIDTFTINFLAPITIPRFNLYTPSALKSAPGLLNFQTDDIIGWLSIDVDKQPLLIKRYKMIIVTIFLTLLGLLISLAVHYFFSKRIYLPISRLRRSMKQILSNEFETRIKVSSQGELGIIEQGCVHLQKQYLHTVNEMNQHIEEATADLQQSLELLEEKNIDLSLEKKKIEEKSQQKSEFIANMSHEIRTPMNGLIGFTNILMETRLDALQMDYVKTIKSSAQDLLTVINDILDYSKMDAGKLQLDSIPLDIRHCIDEVLVLAAPHAHKKGLDLIPITRPEVPAIVFGDPFRIKQIIGNLVNNAIKFTDQGQVLIRTKIQQETDKHYVLSLSVIDTGRGLSSEEQARLFTAFQQADTSITRRYGGSGLGLVICKKLVETMQGRIILDSKPGKGSVFTAQITLEKLPTYEIQKPGEHRFGSLKAICFDEHPEHLEALINGITFLGISCIPCNSLTALQQAMESLPLACGKEESASRSPLVALINIPTGQESAITALLKNNVHNIPSIVLSKWPVADYTSLHAHGFLFKPLGIQKLLDTIDSVLNHNHPQTPTKLNPDELRLQLKALQLTVLLAEDNPVNRYLLKSLLQECVVLEEVEDGKTAVQKCQDRRFDAILLDLQMPHMHGLDAASHIHNQSLLNAQTPIAIISASGNHVSNRDMHKAGVTAWIQKPIDEQEFLLQLLNLVQTRSEKIIDWALCVKRAGGKTYVAQEFLHRFIAELQKDREHFLTLLHKNDLKGLEESAHKLHGACCYCGVPALQKKVIRVETLAQSLENTEALQQAMSELIHCMDIVLKEYASHHQLEKNKESEPS